jgi:hypothetical protein
MMSTSMRARAARISASTLLSSPAALRVRNIWSARRTVRPIDANIDEQITQHQRLLNQR